MGCATSSHSTGVTAAARELSAPNAEISEVSIALEGERSELPNNNFTNSPISALTQLSDLDQLAFSSTTTTTVTKHDRCPRRVLFPEMEIIPLKGTFDISLIQINVNSQRFSPRDQATLEVQECIQLLKAWLTVPGVLQLIALVCGCATETEVANALCSRSITIDRTKETLLFDCYGFVDRSDAYTQDTIYLHAMLVDLLSYSVQDAYPELIYNHIFLNTKTMFRELIHIANSRINVATDVMFTGLDTEKEQLCATSGVHAAERKFRTPPTIIGTQTFTDAGEMFEMLVFGGVVQNQAHQVGTFLCDKLLCIDNIKNATGYFVENVDKEYIDAIRSNSMTLQGLRLTGNTRGATNYAEWCSRRMEDDCALVNSYPKPVYSLLKHGARRRPTDDCSDIRKSSASSVHTATISAKTSDNSYTKRRVLCPDAIPGDAQ